MKQTLGLLSLLVFALAFTFASYATAQAPTAPPYCKPCLFYGGDMDPANPTTGYIGNQDTAFAENQAIYIPFRVPPNQNWEVIGLFVNELADQGTNDPRHMNWSISMGVGNGRKGKLIAGGTINDTMTPTGRSFNGFTEYTVLGFLSPTTVVNLTPGVYWMTAIPVCIIENECNANNGNGGGFWLGSVEDVPPPNAVGVEPWDESFMLYPDGGEFYQPVWGEENALCQYFLSCDRFSAGLLGRATAAN